MIYDILSRLGSYSSIPFVHEIEGLVAGNALGIAEQGFTPLVGEDVILKKSSYIPADGADNRFEAHRTYADLQIVLSGREILRTVFPSDASQISAYNGNDDVEFFSADSNVTDFILQEDRFIYLAPGEIHQPGCPSGDYSGKVVKCVIKIRCP
jgi:biofilm protein TabA